MKTKKFGSYSPNAISVIQNGSCVQEVTATLSSSSPQKALGRRGARAVAARAAYNSPSDPQLLVS